jgi:serine/threonine protein kinase
MNLKSGELVSHYRIKERLGAGGMGIVYKAEDTRLKRPVALKFLPQDDSLTPHAKERFIHEAQAASALDHPNICTIHEIGETGDGELFLVMSCYEGETLRSKIQRGTLTAKDSVAIALQLCDGLGAAHHREIVHRDLKPDNIMVLSDGLVKVLDFGLAKFMGQTKLTTEGTTLGTVWYMSPEQVQSTDVDNRTDIYSISVILYEMLTGELPFKGDHHLATFYLIVNQPPIPPRRINPAIPEALEQVVLTGMSKERELRFQSCAVMRDQLLLFAEGGKADAVKQDEVPPTHRDAAAALGRGKTPHFRWKRATTYGGLALAGVALAAAAFLLLRSPAHQNDRAIARTHRDRAIALMDVNQLTEANAELDSALMADPSYSLTWSTLAAVNIRLGNMDLAIAQGRKAVELDSNNANGEYNLGYALEGRGEFRGALACYFEAVRIDSLYMPAQSALASLYLRLNNPDEATVVLERAIRIDPPSRYSFLLYRTLGKACLNTGKVSESIAALKKSIELRPDQGAEPHHILAGAYQSGGMIKEARAELQLCIALESDPVKKEEASQMLRKLGEK